jgi:hypothetical protein
MVNKWLKEFSIGFSNKTVILNLIVQSSSRQFGEAQGRLNHCNWRRLGSVKHLLKVTLEGTNWEKLIPTNRDDSRNF